MNKTLVNSNIMTYTRPFDITDHPDYSRDDSNDDNVTCDYCGNEYHKSLLQKDELSEMVVCYDCLISFKEESRKYGEEPKMKPL